MTKRELTNALYACPRFPHRFTLSDGRVFEVECAFATCIDADELVINRYSKRGRVRMRRCDVVQIADVAKVEVNI